MTIGIASQILTNLAKKHFLPDLTGTCEETARKLALYTKEITMKVLPEVMIRMLSESLLRYSFNQDLKEAQEQKLS